MKKIVAEVELASSAERVGELLADFSLYKEWNPVLPRVSPRGSGDRYDLVVHLPGMDPFGVRATKSAVNGSSVSWKSTLWCGFILTWSYSLRIFASAPEKVVFVQESEFSGLLAPLFCLALNRPAASGLEQMGMAVKRWGEKGNVRCLKC